MEHYMEICIPLEFPIVKKCLLSSLKVGAGELDQIK